MPHYSSDSELYADLGECLREVLCDPANADRARAVGSVIRIETVRPKAQLTLNLAADAEPAVEFGESALRPGAVITIDADAARDFFLGEASLIAALSAGKMKAQGPVDPILRVVPLANLVAPVFRERDGGAPPAGEPQADETPAEEEVAAGESPADGDEPAGEADEAPAEEESPADDEAPAEEEEPADEKEPAEEASGEEAPAGAEEAQS